LFDWASELLVLGTLDPAVAVFEDAATRYPKSQRLMVGLGMAYYAREIADDAVTALLKAADLDPSDARCYKFLARAYDSSPSQATEVIERFKRFAELQPRNGQALYYYAISLCKCKLAQEPDFELKQIETLLQKSITADEKLPEAHLQLGNLKSDQGRFVEAIPEYRRALQLDSDLADAHYRLGQAYVRTGQKELAQEQLQVYQQLRTAHLADLEKQRAEIRQFVYSSKDVTGAKQ
jgi:Flp pilus assembly protein TadD